MGNRWDGIPADLFVDILHRLPPSPRRRLRLVCRHWRNIIDDRAPEPPARAKVLAFVTGDVVSCNAHAYVFDDLTEEQINGRDLKLRRGVGNGGSIKIGTCNGLLCLRRYSADVVVVNPVTGEKLAIPPPPSRKPNRAHTPAVSYSFAYHPATGLYKVVRVPREDLSGGAFDAVGVFTLGDTSWREVPVAGGSSWLLSFGLVSVDGAVHWVSKDACSVMSFDLSDERLAFVTTLPVRVQMHMDISWRLTADASGRLGIAVCSFELYGSKTEVWVLEEGGRHTKRTWVLQCKIEERGHRPLQEIALPHATHGEHVLTTMARGRKSVSLHVQCLSEARTHGGMVWMEERTPSPSIGQYDNCSGISTFAYVETKEPLALYAYDDGEVGENDDWEWELDSRERRWKLVPRGSWLFDLHVN
ncbi:unnamed protein product [Urochloa humidicola]